MAAVALANTPPSPAAVDSQWLAFETGYLLQLVNAQAISANGATAFFNLPYLQVNSKSRLILTISAMTGTTPGLAVGFYESVDGVNYNSAAALSIASQTATGTYYSAVNSGVVFNGGQVQCTVAGTTPNITFSLYLAAWNR